MLFTDPESLIGDLFNIGAGIGLDIDAGIGMDVGAGVVLDVGAGIGLYIAAGFCLASPLSSSMSAWQLT
jgi:hypothetical protein